MPMAQSPAGYVPLKGSERRPRPGAQLVGPADPNERFRVIVRIRRRSGAPSLPDHDYWMATPPGRRKFLTTEEFAATYGAATEDIEKIVEFARQHDLAVVESSIACRTVALSGTVAQMGRAFAVELGRYQSGDAIYRGRDGFVHVP